MVSIANTVVKIGAVVVKSFNTPISNISVSAPWSSDDLTVRTEIIRIGSG